MEIGSDLTRSYARFREQKGVDGRKSRSLNGLQPRFAGFNIRTGGRIIKVGRR